MPRLGRSQPFAAKTRRPPVVGAAAGAIAITSPVADQFRWWGAAKSAGAASFTLAGTYSGTPTTIEWSKDGSTWTTLVASPAGNAYTGTIGLPAGQFTVSVRFGNSHAVTASVASITVGPVLATAGQSNSTGRGTGNQVVYAPAGMVHVEKTATSYAALADPYAATIDAGAAGSFVPAMASALGEAVGSAFGIVPTGAGGTSITQWQSGGSLYIAMKAAILAVGGCDGILWWQGETDAVNAMSQATYHADLAAFVASVQADLACPVLPCALQQMPTGTVAQANQDAINAAIVAGWADIAGCKPGPDLRPIPAAPEDTFHLFTDAKLCTAGALWAAAAYKALFQPTGGSGSAGFAPIGCGFIKGV